MDLAVTNNLEEMVLASTSAFLKNFSINLTGIKWFNFIVPGYILH